MIATPVVRWRSIGIEYEARALWISLAFGFVTINFDRAPRITWTRFMRLAAEKDKGK